MPPSTKVQAREAAKLFEEFTGHKARFVDVVEVPEYKHFLKVGSVDGILYTTRRDGKTEHYIHEFRASSRPLLAVSFDGEEIKFVGGRYRFTERGIVDQ